MPVGLRPPWVKISQRSCSPRLRHFLGVDRHHDALVAEFLRRFLDEAAPLHRRGVDRHLVGARGEQRADILDGAHAAADGERHEAGLRRAPHHVEDDVAVLVAGRDVEEAELVGAGRVIGDRRSTGSPASRRSTKLTPLTTRPSFTSRQGMTRTLNMAQAAVVASRMQLERFAQHRAARHRARGRRWRRRAFSRAAPAAP